MASSAQRRPTLSNAKYWDQFYSALTCATREDADAWMADEVERYEKQFSYGPVVAWQTIVCNLAFFAGYYGADAVRKIYQNFGGLDACFAGPGFTQYKRARMNESETAAKDSPV